MALYKKSRTYRAFDSEKGCFFNKTFTFSCEIDEKYNRGIEKSRNTFGKSYTILFLIGCLLLCGTGISLAIITKITKFLIIIACIPLFPIIESCREDVLYDKYERPLEDKFEAMYEEICQEERNKAKLWLKQYEDEPITARIQQVVNELNRG